MIGTDKWGGSIEKRIRFHLEVIQEIRQKLGSDFPLIIKFGVMDDEDGGLTLSESISAAQHMENNGIDSLEISTGSNKLTHSTPVLKKDAPEQTYFRKRAASIKQAVDVPVMVVGGIRSLEKAKEIVNSGDADLISMCRPFICEPNLVARWQAGDIGPSKCISCNRCLQGGVLTCRPEYITDVV